jgi:hypothetical protein
LIIKAGSCSNLNLVLWACNADHAAGLFCTSRFFDAEEDVLEQMRKKVRSVIIGSVQSQYYSQQLIIP